MTSTPYLTQNQLADLNEKSKTNKILGRKVACSLIRTKKFSISSDDAN